MLQKPGSLKLGSLKLIRRGDVLALKTPSGSVLGFHARSLEVAELGPEVWSALAANQNPTASSNLTSQEHEALAELVDWEKSDAPSARDAVGRSAVRSMTINIAQICNLACTYCAAGGDGTYGSKTKKSEVDLVREQLTPLLAAVPNGDRFEIIFLGGEPLLYPEILQSIARDAKLMVAGRDIDVDFAVVTNGTLVNSAIAEMLAQLKMNVTISLDGSPEDNDRSRVTKSGKGSTAQALKGLVELMRVRKQLSSLSVGSVFGKHNLQVVEAWKFLSEYPFDSIKFDFAAEENDEALSREYAEQVIQVAELAWIKGGEKELRRISVFDHLFRTLDDQVRIQNHCLAGKSHLQLDTDGKFTVCQWFVGQKEEEVGQGVTLDQTKLSAYAAPLIEMNGCGSCWARYICGGGCMYVNKLKTGNKHTADKAFCERTRTIIAKGIERYAEARYEHFGRFAERIDGDASEIH